MKTKLILEMGCNHNGDFGRAKMMIDRAAEIGAWAVKFQVRDPNSMPPYLANSHRSKDSSFGNTYLEHRYALEFSSQELRELRDYAREKELKFIVSVFDTQSMFEMFEMGIDYLKLPSQLYSNWEMNHTYFEYYKDAAPLIVSTGMHYFSEITRWQFFDKAAITMHCVSEYPHQLESAKFGKFASIRNALKSSRMGFSCHSTIESIYIAVLMGAEFVEAHFTLDKTLKGSDHKTVSFDPPEVKEIIAKIGMAELILNDKDSFKDPEHKLAKLYRSPY